MRKVKIVFYVVECRTAEEAAEAASRVSPPVAIVDPMQCVVDLEGVEHGHQIKEMIEAGFENSLRFANGKIVEWLQEQK